MGSGSSAGVADFYDFDLQGRATLPGVGRAGPERDLKALRRGTAVSAKPARCVAPGAVCGLGGFARFLGSARTDCEGPGGPPANLARLGCGPKTGRMVWCERTR